MKNSVPILRLAAVNMCPVFGDIAANLNIVEKWVASVSRQHVQLACFPEMALCGYTNSDAVLGLAISLSSPTMQQLCETAQNYGMTLLVGFCEDNHGKYHISHAVITPDGVRGAYRKTHLSPPEQRVFTPGDAIPVFQHEEWRFGIQLCYDTHYPELSAIQARQGAQILFMPFASPREAPRVKKERLLRYIPARAYDNSCYVVTCNLTGAGPNGQTFGGVALIVDPKGQLLAEHVGPEEGAVVASVSHEEIERIKRTRMGYFLAGRRPDLYREHS